MDNRFSGNIFPVSSCKYELTSIRLFCLLFLLFIDPISAQQVVDFKTHINDGSSKKANQFINTLTPNEQVWLKEHPVIRVVMDPSWPPFEFLNEKGKHVGISNDYLTLIQQRLGVEFKIMPVGTWQDAYNRLKTWDIDMTTCVAETDERKEFWAFTKPYSTSPIVIFTNNDITYISDMNEMNGKTVAVVGGYAVQEWLARDYPSIRVQQVQTPAEGIDLLQQGEVFAYLDNMLVIGYYIAQKKLVGIKIAGHTPYVNAQCMAVRKDWAIFAGILQKALEDIPAEQHNKIYHKWTPIKYEHGFNYHRLWQITILFAVILGVLLFWIVMLMRQISKRKKVERELVRKNDEISRYLYTASHDLRTPLVTVAAFLGYVEKNARQGHIEELNKDLGYIRSATNSMKKQLDDVLNYAQIGTARNPFQDCPLNAIVDSALELLAGLIKEKNVDVHITDVPIILHGDPPRLIELFQNLFDNAIKFRDEDRQPSITIGAELKENEINIIVRDNGIGIDPQYHQRLFDLFEQLHSDTEGVGMGLSIVKRIVDLHKGKITVQSNTPEKGTTFYIQLPDTYIKNS